MGVFFNYPEVKFREKKNRQRCASTEPLVACLKNYLCKKTTSDAATGISNLLDILFSKDPPFRNEKTKCFLLGLSKLNFAKVNQWGMQCFFSNLFKKI